MTAHRMPEEIVVTLAAEDDFAGWRDNARALLAAGVAPDRLHWTVEGADADLFAKDALPNLPVPDQPVLRVPREMMATLRSALLHNDPSRFAIAYWLLWRLRTDPGAGRDPADPDMMLLRAFAKAVRRDIHKMHAFVRFRKTGELQGREQFAAWFEPEHHIGRAVAGFFRDRFFGMDWLIVTPAVSIAWDGAALLEGPGGVISDVPSGDAVEAEWRAYYSSIFNPARVKIAAMKKEMPVKYWRNLPEAALIPSLVRNAGARVEDMVRNSEAEPTLFDAAPASPPPLAAERHFDSIAAFNTALLGEEAAPSEGFSDRIVTGEGPADAQIMLVGEQPGDQEDLAGRPFVGPAGQLLDRSLVAAGIDRASVYLTNAVKRFKFTPRGKRRVHSTPTAGDIAHYRWWLGEEVRLVAPRIVVALGSSAVHALTGRKQALGPLRGSAMAWEERELLVTVHPSFLLRLPDEQARSIEQDKFIRDLRLAAAA